MTYRVRHSARDENIEKVFVREGAGTYSEITYDDFELKKKTDLVFAEKHFLRFRNVLMEVSETEYTDYYRERNHARYLIRRDQKHRLRSLDVIDTETVADDGEDVSQLVCAREEIRALRKSLGMLGDEERKLIDALFYRGMTERELARQYGISKGSIYRQKVEVFNKLRKMIQIFM